MTAPALGGELLAALLASLTVLLSAVVALRMARHKPPRRRRPTSIAVLRPCDKISEEERRALQTPLSVPQQLVSGGDKLNRKLGHLQAAIATLDVEVVVIADTDVFLDDALLDALLTTEGNVVVAAPAPEPGATVSSHMAFAALTQTLHDFRALHALSPTSICGKAMALDKRGQTELLRVDDCLAEDLALAERIAAGGGTITLTQRRARTLPSAGVARFARWFQALKAHHPLRFWTLPLFIAPLPLLALSPRWFAIALLARAATAAMLERRRLAWFWLGELLLIAAFGVALGRALLKRDVIWRGRRLVVGAAGRILEHR